MMRAFLLTETVDILQQPVPLKLCDMPVPEIRESDGVYPDPAYIVPGTPPAYGFFCRHVQGLEFHNVQVGFESPDGRAALVCEDVSGLEMDGFEAERIPGSAPSVIIRE